MAKRRSEIAKRRAEKCKQHEPKAHLGPKPKNLGLLLPSEINALGFQWPSQNISADLVVTNEEGRVDLAATIKRLEDHVEVEERILADAHNFKMKYGGQMSVLEYSDYKDSYDDNRSRRERLKRGIGLIKRILAMAQELWD